MKKYYLAYGSNLNKTQMNYRCPDAKAIGTAYLNDYELLFKGSKTGSYLTVEKKKGSKVPLGVWEVSNEDEMNLDIYEGYPNFYYKKNIEIEVTKFNGDKEKLNAFIYIMHEDHKIGIPTNYYIYVCAEGYKDFGFNNKYLANALELARG